MKISASIVLFNTDKKALELSVSCFLSSPVEEKKLYIIDNSPTDRLRDFFLGEINTIYIFNPSNTGFGAAHNIAIKEAMDWGADYHFVINPDVSATEEIVKPMIEYMRDHQSIGMMMPQILNIDGTSQNLPKLLPSPYSVLMRKIKFPRFVYRKFINKYELREMPQDQIYEVPILSGCFSLFRVSALKKIGLYDDRFFMYFEDWDLSRRMHKEYKTVYFPSVSVYHGYESGANKSKRLFNIYISSAIHYFNKWGWIFDKDRKKINKKTLEQF